MNIAIRPGILVALRTSVHGGVQYRRVDLSAEAAQEGAAVKRWETTRIVVDPEAHERARRARTEAAGLVRKACSATSFGLLCPTDDEDALDAAIVAAKQIVADQNDRDRTTRVELYVLKGRIAENDREAARAIASEMRELLDEMNVGIGEADAAKIRDAASRARVMAAVLGPEQQAQVQTAIETARAAARAIVKRVEKAGEDAALVVQGLVRGPIEAARFAFLDADDEPGEQAPAENALPEIEARRFGDMMEAG